MIIVFEKERLVLSVAPDETVSTLKEKIAERIERNASNLRLIVTGKLLKDDNASLVVSLGKSDRYTKITVLEGSQARVPLLSALRVQNILEIHKRWTGAERRQEFLDVHIT